MRPLMPFFTLLRRLDTVCKMVGLYRLSPTRMLASLYVRMYSDIADIIRP